MDLDKLFPPEVGGRIAGVFRQMEWAEDEIAAAKLRHPKQCWLLDLGFRLAQPTLDIMQTEFVYRAHVRELLERLVAGHDTRPGTDAEVVGALSRTSLEAPLRSELVGLFECLFKRMAPEVYARVFPEDNTAHYQQLYGSGLGSMAEWEVDVRKQMRQEWRVSAPQGQLPM